MKRVGCRRWVNAHRELLSASPFELHQASVQGGNTALHEHHEAVAWWHPPARSCPARCPWNGAVALWVSVPGTTAFPLLGVCSFSQWRKRNTAIARFHDVSARWRIATSGQLERPGRHFQQRGHVSPPVAALGASVTSPLYHVRCSVVSVSGHGGGPPCPGTTRLSRGLRGSCGARPLRPHASL